jgi:hypothetical protein
MQGHYFIKDNLRLVAIASLLSILTILISAHDGILSSFVTLTVRCYIGSFLALAAGWYWYRLAKRGEKVAPVLCLLFICFGLAQLTQTFYGYFPEIAFGK